MSSVKPLSNYVVAKQTAVQKQTAGGFYLPDSATEKPKVAEVVAVGKEVLEVAVGDQILYKSYGPSEFRVNDEELLIIKEDDILAVVK
jgi:chaperonin GroES